MKAKELVMLGMMSAILVTVQVALGFIPNVELISLLIILCTIIYGWKTLYIIYTFTLVEGFIYGFGDWWFNYLYVWTILLILAMIFRKNRSSYFWAILSGIYGLCFGALCSLLYLFIGGLPMAIAKWVNGIIFDLAHGISNFTVALILFRPIYYILNLLNQKLVETSKTNH